MDFNTELKQLAHVKVLGKPLQIGDVLRALDLNSTDESTRVSVSANFMRIGIMEDFALINLALPLSHPDNDKACGKVLAILNKGHE